MKSLTKGFSQPIANWLVDNRLITFIASILLIAATIPGLTNLTFNADYKVFFDQDNPQLQAHEFIEATYSKGDNILFILAPKNNNVFTPKHLDAVEWLTEQSWLLPYSQRVDSITNFQHTSATDDDLLVEDLVENALDKTTAEIDVIQSIAINDPLLIHRLISPTGHVTAVNATLTLPDIDTTTALAEVILAARELEKKFTLLHPGFDVYISGMAPFTNAFSEVANDDMARLMPVMMGVILVMVSFLLRSVASAGVTLSIVIVTVISTFGIVGWFNVELNSINTAAPTIILTLAVADCIHLLTHFLTQLKLGKSKIDAMKFSLDINLLPVFLTSFTTAIGFLSMNFSDSPPFRELGTISALGVAIAFVFSITLLPQLAMWLTRKTPSQDLERNRNFEHLANFTIKHQNALFWGTLILAFSAMSFIPQNELNDDNVEYFSKNVKVRQAADFAEKNLGGVNVIVHSLSAGETNGINDIAYLTKVSDFVDWYRAQPEVMHVFSYTEIIKRLNKNMHNDDDAWYRLPDSRELAAQYSLMYEMSLPFGMDLNNQINLDKSSIRITVTLSNIKAKEILALESRAQEWLAINAPNITSPGAGQSIMFSNIGQRNILSMINGTIIATLLISLTLMLSLGSWKLGLVSLIPNAFPPLIMFGLWGLFVGEVNLGVAVVFSVTLGIVVDDTVHFLSKFLRAKKDHGHNTEQAIHYAFTHVGASLLITTFVLALGFGTLYWSNFTVNSTLGLMVALTILLAIVFDFLFLPALLLKLSSLTKKLAR
ncbi:MAG: RND transporter [Moraxellaceae bacterium]|nr:MAG: RND transporter [Moraxellaceae bacterium]